MKQEDKDLLLKDICARLSYGVKCSFGVDDAIYEICGINPVSCGASEIQATHIKSGINGDFAINACKPYLFPLSSMTEEQREELYKIGWYLDEDKIYSCFRNYDDANYKTHIDCFELISWCYKNNFDINGLIPKGFANDATELNIY